MGKTEARVIQVTGAVLVYAVMAACWYIDGIAWRAWTCAGVLAFVLLLDFILIATKRPTISEWVQNLLHPKGDYVVLVLVMANLWWTLGVVAFVPFMAGVILGHFHWNGR